LVLWHHTRNLPGQILDHRPRDVDRILGEEHDACPHLGARVLAAMDNGQRNTDGSLESIALHATDPDRDCPRPRPSACAVTATPSWHL
jgi:hypothetical protein